jgi:hypothetical protein
MKVKQLINRLKDFDPETRVVCFSAEGGYHDLEKLIEIEVAIDFHKEGPWIGPHQFRCFLTDSHTGSFEKVISIG